MKAVPDQYDLGQIALEVQESRNRQASAKVENFHCEQ
jgi:hypothetical protein